jgi:putative addiction module component (TIGR02574 family)
VDTRLHELSIDEKLQLVEELWNSIAADNASLPLTEAQREELDRRLDEFEADGDLGRDATSVLDEIRQRL